MNEMKEARALREKMGLQKAKHPTSVLGPSREKKSAVNAPSEDEEPLGIQFKDILRVAVNLPFQISPVIPHEGIRDFAIGVRPHNKGRPVNSSLFTTPKNTSTSGVIANPPNSDNGHPFNASTKHNRK